MSTFSKVFIFTQDASWEHQVDRLPGKAPHKHCISSTTSQAPWHSTSQAQHLVDN